MTQPKLLPAPTLVISEIFGPTIQGEGALVGRPTVFVRLAGCDYRCAWCDSMHAVDPVNKPSWQRMTVSDVLDRILFLTKGVRHLVTLSGGNPALQPAVGHLIGLGHAHDYTFACETQGSRAQSWFRELEYLVLSPKPPSAKQPFEAAQLTHALNAAMANFPHECPAISFKVVVFDDEDYAFARNIHAEFARPFGLPFYLQAGTHNVLSEPQNLESLRRQICERTAWLAERVTAEKWHDVFVLPQMHALLWGNEKGR